MSIPNTASIQNLTNSRNLSDTVSCKCIILFPFQQYKFEGLEYETADTKIFLLVKSFPIFFYTLIINAKGMHSCNLSAGRAVQFSFILILFCSHLPSYYLHTIFSAKAFKNDGSISALEGGGQWQGGVG